MCVKEAFTSKNVVKKFKQIQIVYKKLQHKIDQSIDVKVKITFLFLLKLKNDL